MMGRTVLTSPALPLFHWPELAEVARIEQQRRELQRRIQLLPLQSDRSVELRARLKDLTLKELVLQSRLERRP